MTQARSWAEVRAQKAPQISHPARAAARAELDAEIAGYRLKQIRREQRRTQTQVADEMQVSQRRVSAIESAALSTTEVGTIAAYVAALGGRLRLLADFGGETVVIHSEAASAPSAPTLPLARKTQRKAGDNQVAAAMARSRKAPANAATRPLAEAAKKPLAAATKAAPSPKQQPKKAPPKRSHAASPPN